jgi:hypothetical protein
MDGSGTKTMSNERLAELEIELICATVLHRRFKAGLWILGKESIAELESRIAELERRKGVPESEPEAKPPYAQVIKARRLAWEKDKGRRMRGYEEWFALYPDEGERKTWDKYGKVVMMRTSPNQGERNNAIIMGDQILASLHATTKDIPSKIRRILKAQGSGITEG